MIIMIYLNKKIFIIQLVILNSDTINDLEVLHLNNMLLIN